MKLGLKQAAFLLVAIVLYCFLWITIQQTTSHVSHVATVLAQYYNESSCCRHACAASIPCAQCHPCLDKRRYDRVGPIIQHAISLQLAAVPSQYRLPEQAEPNVTDYLLTSGRVYPATEYLFDYNPSIIQLTHGKAHYLASFRVSNQHYCLHPTERNIMMNGAQHKARNWLGLAWLDEHFQIIQDTVLDIRSVGFPAAEDFRLVRLGDEIYLSSYDQIAPLYLHKTNNSVPIPQLYANNTPTVYLRNFVSCAPCRRRRGYCGKNFNYIPLTAGQAAVEIWPSPPHLVRTVYLKQACNRSADPEEFIDAAPALRASFATIEEVLFPHVPPDASLLTRGRGGACCVPWIDPRTQQPVWLGVLHTKTPSQGNRRRVANTTANHYLSQFYAFEQEPPFNLVALSGYFCVGFRGGLDRIHHLARISSWRQLELGITFDCPRIHFVSGITLKSGDSSTVILSLGVNDCYSLFLEIPVNSINDLLFQGRPG